MTGCRGCLGLLVVLALLAWPIEQLQPVLGWSNAQTGGFLLAGVALLAIGSSVRGRAGRRPARTTVSGGEAPEARTARARGSDRIKPTDGVVARHDDRPRDLPASGPGPRYRASGEPPANQAGTSPSKATDNEAHDLFLGLLEPDEMDEAHVNLIRHGREICHARKPDCGHCPVAARCRYADPKALDSGALITTSRERPRAGITEGRSFGEPALGMPPECATWLLVDDDASA